MTNDNYSPWRRPSFLKCVPQERCHGQSVRRWIKSALGLQFSLFSICAATKRFCPYRNMQERCTDGWPWVGQWAIYTGHTGYFTIWHKVDQAFSALTGNDQMMEYFVKSPSMHLDSKIGLLSLDERTMTKWWNTLHISPDARGFQSHCCLGTDQSITLLPFFFILRKASHLPGILWQGPNDGILFAFCQLALDTVGF